MQLVPGYTAVSTKVVQKKKNRKSRKVVWEILNKFKINTLKAQNPFYFLAPPSIALKTPEFDDATVNNHNPSCLSVLSRTLCCFSVGQPLSKQLFIKDRVNCSLTSTHRPGYQARAINSNDFSAGPKCKFGLILGA